MILRVKIQESLAVGHLDGDSGEFIFVICRDGFEQTLGRKCQSGEVIKVNAKLKEIK